MDWFPTLPPENVYLGEFINFFEPVFLICKLQVITVFISEGWKHAKKICQSVFTWFL